ncbi:MAG: hypothetical protein ACM3KE_14000 [Hyphomicrobiales bacterium]
MAQELKRKLSAILSADLKGYSRLMGEDEEWTVRTLDTLKVVMKNIIPQHGGRVVDSTGDNLLDYYTKSRTPTSSTMTPFQTRKSNFCFN